MSDEVNMIWLQRWSVGKVLYILTRYWGLLDGILLLWCQCVVFGIFECDFDKLYLRDFSYSRRFLHKPLARRKFTFNLASHYTMYNHTFFSFPVVPHRVYHSDV